MSKGIVFLILLFIVNVVLSQQVQFGNKKNAFILQQISEQELVVENSLQQIDFEKLKFDSHTYYKMKVADYATTDELGNPELPVLKKIVEVPFGAEIKIEIINAEYQDVNLNNYNIYYPIVPKLASVRKDKKLEFLINKATYLNNAWYENIMVQYEVLGIMRDSRLVRLDISPISYNPVTGHLKICTYMKARITFTNYSQAENRHIKELYSSPYFNGVQDGILNSGNIKASKSGNSSVAATYVIVSDTMFQKTLQPFVRWKRKKGFKVIEAYTNYPQVGKSGPQIKAYLKSLYDNATANSPAPSFVLLVGDTTQLTVFKGVSATDHYTDLYFCEYTGDAFPEVLYGRFSASDTNQLKNEIEKTIEYEKYQMANPSFLAKSVLIAGVDNSYSVTHANPQISYANNYYFNTAHSITPSVYLYPNSSGSASNIIQDVNNGAAIVNYTAHGSSVGWANPAFTVSNVSGLTNTGKYPLMIGNACETGRFEQASCFGEALIRAEKKGAIAYIGASNSTYWDEDFYWSVGFKSISSNPVYNSNGVGAYDNMFHDHGENYAKWAMTNAQIVKAGNLAVTQSSSSILYYWEIYHVFGDPSLMVYQYVPGTQVASFNSVIPYGLGNLQILTTPYSMVSMSKNDTLIASVFADSTGQANLMFDQTTPVGTYDLVITAQNKQPYFSNCSIVNPNGPFIIAKNFGINDYQGNKNQIAENGENISLYFEIKNLTNFQTSNLSLKFRSLDTNLLILDSVFQLNGLSGFGNINLDSVFKIILKSGVKNAYQVPFEIYIQDQNNNHWSSYDFINVAAPELGIESVVFSDLNGNNNGHIDVGETVNFKFLIKNKGANSINSVQSNLSASISGISISQVALIDTMNIGESKQIDFTVNVSNNIFNGSPVIFTFEAGNQYYKLFNTQLKMIGNVDEDFETGNFNKYAWNQTAQYPWVVSTNNVMQGVYSARSPLNLPNGSSSSLQISLNILADDSIYFYRKVSSEENYDFLKFYIDNVSVLSWSGEIAWDRIAYPVKAGNRTFAWTYSKDAFGVEGDDAAYIDLICFPINDAFVGLKGVETDILFLKLYPNPASNLLNIILPEKQEGEFSLSIYNQSGQLVKSQMRNDPENFPRVSMDISMLPSGFYTLELIGKTKCFRAKFCTFKNAGEF